MGGTGKTLGRWAVRLQCAGTMLARLAGLCTGWLCCSGNAVTARLWIRWRCIDGVLVNFSYSIDFIVFFETRLEHHRVHCTGSHGIAQGLDQLCSSLARVGDFDKLAPFGEGAPISLGGYMRGIGAGEGATLSEEGASAAIARASATAASTAVR